jgi:hypothetical protein
MNLTTVGQFQLIILLLIARFDEPRRAVCQGPNQGKPTQDFESPRDAFVR